MKRVFLIGFFAVWVSTAVGQSDSLRIRQLDAVTIRTSRLPGSVVRLPDTDGTQLWSGKKNEVLQVGTMNVNLTEKTARQIFAKVPGLFVYDMDGSGNQVNISTRGLDPHRGWEFNIRKNGIITNSDMYGYPASHYSMPMEAVDRIQLVRGTGSLQYGAQFGGLLNYLSKRGDTTRAFSFENVSAAGSFGLLSTYNAIGGKIGKWSYYAYYNKRVSNGYRQNSRTESDAQSILLRYEASKNLSFQWEVARSNYLYQLPGPLTDSQFADNPRQATRSRNFYNPDIYVPSFTIDWRLAPRTKMMWVVSAVLGSRNSVMFDKPATILDAIDPATSNYAQRQVDIDHFNSYTSEWKMLHEYQLLGGTHQLAAGLQLIHNDLHRQQLGRGTSGSDFDLSIDASGFVRDMHLKSKNVAAYVENTFNITPRWQVSPGIRVENGRSDMNGRIDYYSDENLPNSITHRFPLLGLSTQYRVRPQQNLYAGVAQAYRPVIFKDIIPASTYEVVDKDLKDAEGYTAEVGYRGSAGEWQWDVSAFQLRYNHRLGSLSQQDSNGNFYLYRTNIGNSMTRGVELFIERVIHNGKTDWVFFSSSSWMDGRYLTAQVRSGDVNISVKGNHIESVPQIISRSGVTMKKKLFSASVLYSYTGESYADALNTKDPSVTGSVGLVPAYGLLDVNAAVQLQPNLLLRLNVNNALNKSYFTKRPAFYPGPGIWPSDGRSWSVAISLRL